MKNRPPRDVTPYLFSEPSPRMDSDNSPELAGPDPKSERSKAALENTLRWEDDGGPVFRAGHLLPQLA
jgi:hypothetical protein